MGDARNHASKSLLWSSVDTFSQTGFALVALALLAHLLSIEAIGLGSLAVMLVQLANMPFELLFHDALIQRRELPDQHYATALTTAVLGATCGALLLVLAAPWIAAQYHKPQLTNLLRATAIAMPIAAATAVISAVLRRKLSFAPLARRTVLGRMAGVSMGVCVAWAGGGAWALVTMYVVSLALSTLVLVLGERDLPRPHCSTIALRELLQFGVPNMLAQVLLLANGRIFVALSGLQLGDAELGRFSLAFRVVEELRNTLSSAASQLALPLLTRRVHQPVQFAAVYAEATGFTACVLLPLYAGMAITAPDLMSVVFGAKWRDAASTVQWLALASIVVTFRQYSNTAVNAMGRPGINVVVTALVFAASLMMFVGDWVNSADAAAQVWTVRALLLLVASVVVTRHAASLSFNAQLSPTVTPLFAATLMSAAVLLLQLVLTSNSSAALRLSICVALGVCVYVLGLFAASPHLLKRLAGFARTALQRHNAVAG